jgi:hypothetical protein
MSDHNFTSHPDDLSLDVYLDAELSPIETQQIEVHIQACPECRLRLANRRTFFDLISASEEVPLPRDVSMSVLENLQRSRLRSLAGVLSLEAIFAFLLLFVAGSSMVSQIAALLHPARAGEALGWLVDTASRFGTQVHSGLRAIGDTVDLAPLPGISALPVAQLNWLHWAGILSAIVLVWMLSNRVLIGRSEVHRSQV